MVGFYRGLKYIQTKFEQILFEVAYLKYLKTSVVIQYKYAAKA